MTPVPGSVVRTRRRRRAAAVGSVGDDDHARVDRVPDADPAAVVERDPGRAGRRVEQRVQDRPVRDRVRAVAHALGLAVGRRDGARVQVVAADDDRRLELPAGDELVEEKPRAVPLAVAEPADPGRQALERDALLGQRQPARSPASCGKSSSRARSVTRMSSGSPESAAQRNGPLPSQKSGRM